MGLLQQVHHSETLVSNEEIRSKHMLDRISSLFKLLCIAWHPCNSPETGQEENRFSGGGIPPGETVFCCFCGRFARELLPGRRRVRSAPLFGSRPNGFDPAQEGPCRRMKWRIRKTGREQIANGRIFSMPSRRSSGGTQGGFSPADTAPQRDWRICRHPRLLRSGSNLRAGPAA